MSLLLATVLLSLQVFMISAADADFEYASAVYENDVVECFDIAKAALGEYYDACYLLTDANLEEYVANDDLVEYLNAKIALSEHRHIRSGVTYEYSENTFELISWNVYDDAIYLFVATNISQQYKETDKLTGIGEGTDLVFQRVNGKLKITEWYSEDFLDHVSREENVDIEQTLENRIKAAKTNNALIKSNVNINVIDPIDITSSTFSYLDGCMANQNVFFDVLDIQKANAANEQYTSENALSSDNEAVVDVETDSNQAITRASTLRPLQGGNGRLCCKDCKIL